MSNLDRCRFTISNSPGTGGALTVGSAVSGAWVVPGTDQNNQAFEACVVQGSDFEIFETVYTHSGTSLSRGALIKTNTGSRINLSSGAECFLTVSARQLDRYDSAALAHVAGSNANTTMAVGALYVVDGATLTADRTYTLPATAAVGDRVGVMMSAGSASWEVLITAASGDTLNGVAGGTEWSRVFITGETVIMRCVAANTTWVVEQDGRIAQRGKMHLSTAADGETASVYTRPTQAATPGAWTVTWDAVSICDTANDRITPRRAGQYQVVVAYVPKDPGTAASFANLEIRRNGSTVLGGPSTLLSSAGVNRITAVVMDSIAAGDYFDYWYRTQDGGIGAAASATWNCTFAVEEIL